MSYKLMIIGRTFLIFFCLFSGLSAIANGAELPAITYQCHALFVTHLFQTTDRQAQPVPSLFLSLVTFKGQQRKATIQNNESLEKAKAYLEQSRTEALGKGTPGTRLAKELSLPAAYRAFLYKIAQQEGASSWDASKASLHAKSFERRVEAYYQVLSEGIRTAKDVTTIATYRDSFTSRLEDLEKEHSESIAKFRQAFDRIRDLRKDSDPMALRFFNKDILERFSVQVNLIKSSLSGDTALQIAENFSRDLSAELTNWKAKERARLVHEKRFATSVAGNSNQILNAFFEVVKSHIIDVPKALIEGMPALLAEMEKSPTVKNFIYAELQILRKLLPVQSQYKNTIRARIANDLRTLEKASEGQLQVLVGFRKSMMGIHRNEALLRLIPHSTVKRMNSATREQIIAEALSNPVLANLIMTLSIEVPQVPAEPKKPNKPAPLDLKSIVRKYKAQFRGKSVSTVNSLVKQMNRDMNGEMEASKRRMDLYIGDIKSLHSRTLEYRKLVQSINEVRLRKESAQQAWLGYLSARHPELLVARADGSSASAQIQSHLNVMMNRRVASWQRRGYDRNRLNSTVSHLSNSRLRDRSYDDYYNQTSMTDTWDWMLFAVTGNPMWIVSPTIARVQLIFDLLNSHNNSSAQHYVENIRKNDFSGQSLASIESIRDQQMQPSVEDYSAGQRALNDIAPDIKPIDLTAPFDVDRSTVDPMNLVDKNVSDVAEQSRRAVEDANRAVEEANRISNEAVDESTRQAAANALREAEAQQRAAIEKIERLERLAVEEAAQAAHEAEEQAERAAEEAAQAAREAEIAAARAEQDAKEAAAAAELEAQVAAAAAEREAQAAAEAAEREAQAAARQAEAEAAKATADAEAAAASDSNDSSTISVSKDD